MTITLGSLFDGIGVFPLAASRHGITPIWASEIVPDAISITKRHFPEMEHLGDITKLDGGKYPPSMLLPLAHPVKICHPSCCSAPSISWRESQKYCKNKSHRETQFRKRNESHGET